VFAPGLPLEEIQLELELLTDTELQETVIEVRPDSPEPPLNPPAMSELPTEADQESERKVTKEALN
jgi:hypothetical protein